MVGTIQIPLAFTDSERVYADLPPALLKNRILERNVTQKGGEVFLARPGSKKLATFGSGPIRATYSLPGLFDGSAFIVSGNSLYRRTPGGTTIPITGYVYGGGAVSMAGVKGSGYEYLFIADGSHLQVYSGGTNASGTLTGTAHVSEGDTIQIGSSYYQWTATVGTGSGTAADPWKVLLGASLSEDLANMVKAITFAGTPGTDFSSNLAGQNGEVTATSTATTLDVTALSDLSDGNLIATTVPTGTTVSWGSATLTGGGVHGLNGVEVPDGLPPATVAVLKSYVIVTLVGYGKFFWLEPGTIVIDPLNFADAESKPDATLAATTVGDTVWFIGEDSTEVWYPTGGTPPFRPVSGRSYDRGAVEGTVANVKGTVFLVGPDNIVYAIAGSPTRVSDNGIEETIRKALE